MRAGLAAPAAEAGSGSAEGDRQGGPDGDNPLEASEEARQQAKARDPSAPTKAQWEEHQSTHLPFRSWCPHCVAGRLDNPPHRRLPERESTVPEVHLDYAFCRRQDEDKVVPLRVIKHRQSRAVRCWVVPQKGALDVVAAEVAEQGLRDFGITGAVILKSDNEEAINALRRRVMALHPGATLEQTPAAYEHESNGVIENGNQGRIPCSHPVFSWLTEYTGDVLSKHLVGKDGKTPYERLFGKPVHEEALEFAELLWWRPPRTAGYNVLMEPRWRSGIWLGRKWGSTIHVVFDTEGGQVHEVRAVQRRPATERWSLAAVQAIETVPRILRRASADEAAPVIIEPAEGIPDVPPPPPVNRGPNRIYIEDADLRTYGYTAGCSRCMHMRAGLPCRGLRHQEACRQRIEAHLREAGDPRAAAVDARWASRIVSLGDPSARPRAEEGQGESGAGPLGTGPLGSRGPELAVGSSSSSGLGAAGLLGTGLPGPAARAESGPLLEPSGLPDGGIVDAATVPGLADASSDGMEVASTVDPMLEALVARMPPALAMEARGMRNLFIIKGCSPREARQKVAELYSPPRVTRELKTPVTSRACPGLVVGPTFDLQSDEAGQAYDFRLAADRGRCWGRLRSDRPWLVIGSPPCTWWSTLMSLNIPRMDPEEVSRRQTEAWTLLGFACQVYRFQLSEGRHFLHEGGRGPGTPSRWWSSSGTRGSGRWWAINAGTVSEPRRPMGPGYRSRRPPDG